MSGIWCNNSYLASTIGLLPVFLCCSFFFCKLIDCWSQDVSQTVFFCVYRASLVLCDVHDISIGRFSQSSSFVFRLSLFFEHKNRFERAEGEEDVPINTRSTRIIMYNDRYGNQLIYKPYDATNGKSCQCHFHPPTTNHAIFHISTSETHWARTIKQPICCFVIILYPAPSWTPWVCRTCTVPY